MKTTYNTPSTPALALRIGGGICFIGHGVLALGAKAGFVGLLGSFGLDEAQAAVALGFIGGLDILVGMLILLKPHKRVLQWALVWTTLTVVAWGIHGDSLPDLARRATYITTPLALLLLLYRREKSSGSVPVGTSDRKDQSRGPTEKQEAAIDELDFSMIRMKLMDTHEGPGWSARQCVEVEAEYRRFLLLHLFFPEAQIVPNRAIDTFWHAHILDTAAYQRDCQAIFGRLLHHYPYFGMGGKGEQKQFVNAYDRTKELYEQTFGQSMDGVDYLPSFRVRRSA